MDLASVEITVLSECGLYAYRNSIALSPNTARVATMTQLKNYLKSNFPNEYITVTNIYGSLERFLKGPGRDYVRSELTRPWAQWNYELMTLDKYRLDKRHEHNCFSSLNINDNSSPATLLFIFYDKEDKRRFEAERALINKQEREEAIAFFTPPPPVPQPQHSSDPVSDEIFEFYNNVKPTKDFFNKADSLIKRIQRLVDKVWPDMNYQVTNFGSTANKLCFKDADLDLCIVVPKAPYEQELKMHKNKLSRQPKSVYNMYFLASRLRSIGMTSVEAIGNATVPICKFIDPQTGFRCDINANNVLGIENTRLIRIYADLDARVRPFITAIKYFVKQKDINSPVGGTLSSYAYVLMALHFLIAGLEKPVIPSLQTLDANCKCYDCHSRTNKSTLVYFKHKLLYCDTRYHDCVTVRNLTTNKYARDPCFHRPSTTVWNSYNNDSVSDLLCKFFEYFSLSDNHVVSIFNNQGDLVDYGPSYWNDYIIVQDPFLHTKNIARTSTAVGTEIIVKEFRRAARLLRGNTAFSVVCDKQYNIPKPVDTESMDYRFNQQKQQKQRHREQYAEPSQRNDEIVDEEYEKDLDLLDRQREFNKRLQEQANLRKLKELQDEAIQRALKEAAEQEEARQRAIKEAAEKEEAKRRALKEAEEKEAARKEAEKQEAERRLKEKQRVLEEAAQRKKQQEEQALFDKMLKDEAEKQKKQEENRKKEKEESYEKLQLEIKKEILSQNSSAKTRPIHKLVNKFFDNQPSDYANGAPKPCMNMHDLLDDPLMQDVTVGDIMYLMSQLNFMRNVIAEKFDSVFEEEDEKRVFAGVMTPFTAPSTPQQSSGNPSNNSSSSDTQNNDVPSNRETLTVFNVPTILSAVPTKPKQENIVLVPSVYAVTENGNVKQNESNGIMLHQTSMESEEEEDEDEESYEDYEFVDVQCLVENVPNEFDNYEIYTQLVWHGRVLEITPSKQLTHCTTWRVHMQVLYSTLKAHFPSAIQLGISESDFYKVSTPILV